MNIFFGPVELLTLKSERSWPRRNMFPEVSNQSLIVKDDRLPSVSAQISIQSNGITQQIAGFNSAKLIHASSCQVQGYEGELSLFSTENHLLQCLFGRMRLLRGLFSPGHFKHDDFLESTQMTQKR